MDAVAHRAGPYLGIYLNDHVMGASAGLALFRRAAARAGSGPRGDALRRLAEEVREDRDALLATAESLGVPVRRYKVAAGRLLETAGRLKPNGHLVTRSPLSDLVELEGLTLGVQGKEAGWRSLLAVADRYPALDPEQLEQYAARARRQAAELERMREDAARDTLSPG